MRSNLLTMAVALGATAWLLWPGAGDESHPPADGGAELLLDRVWIDRAPNAPTDKFNVFIALHESRGGSFVHTSAYEGNYSVFQWRKLDKGRMELVMLQPGETHHLRFQVASRNCRGFDYCMQLRGAPRGAELYYSMSDWVIESGELSGPGATIDQGALMRAVRRRVTASR